MKNSNTPSEQLLDEIDLRILINSMIFHKKKIFLSVIVFAFISFLYTSQKEAHYESTAFIEIGLNESEDNLIESPDELIKKLKIDLLYKQQINPYKLEFEAIEDKLVSYCEYKVLYLFASSSLKPLISDLLYIS